ncbi:SDR family oxidoreductase [Stutzerimonas tarimensis]|uniref:SDR family oxidoreductase n=1 Tax=Stutzerimonas tarimensis TaxID=1507735 RepID=A0ABV7T596_9GAMM
MNLTLKPLREQVIVITGASSGIGLATARMAVEAGARVVLVARNEEALADIQRQLDAGDRLMYVVADVGKREELDRVASDTLDRFGGFDTWINNAGASVWGRLDEVDDEDHHRVMQTNYWGTLYGSTIAMAHLREKGGAIINIGSLESAVALPFHATYSASKHAIKALTEVMRVELQKSQAPISVTLVRPSSTDTLFMDHSKNRLPSAPIFPPPVYAPEVVAQAILYAAEHPQRDVYIGNTKFLTRLAQHAPGLTDWIKRTFIYDKLQSGKPDSDPQGALHNADVGNAIDGLVSGNYPGRTMKTSLYTRASQHPVATTAAVMLGALTLASLMTRRR